MRRNTDRAYGRRLREFLDDHSHANQLMPSRCNLLTLLTVAALSLWFRYANNQADRGERILEGSPDFRYTI